MGTAYSGREQPAAALTGFQVGTVISFDWRLPVGKTFARITGELRQVSHSASDTVVLLCSRYQDAAGSTDEFVLMPGQPITREES